MDLPELAEAFKDHQRQGPHRHGQLMQRVQELMGQGIDVSSLFAHIVSTTSTRDIPVKRASYAFLSRYGSQNEELCILCINTLIQDCADLDPVVRALALRTICSLGQKSVLRFMLQPLNSGLQDKNAHVRKTAAMACISLHELDPLFVLESEIVDRLYGLLRDRDAQVVISSIMALEAILVDEGGLVVNQAIAAYLLKRFKDWNSGQLQIILANDIDDGLRHSSMAVQMATLRLFIWLSQDLDEIQDELRNTIEETLLGHLESPVPEYIYGSLCHLGLLLEMNGRFLHDDLAHISALFCKLDDSVEIKLKKLEICAMVAIKTKTIATSELAMRAILDHLGRMATMLDLITLQKQSPDRSTPQSGRHALETHVRVACRAIELIGLIGSTQQRPQGGIDSSQEEPTQNSRDSSTMMRPCLHRLFRLLAVYSGLEYTYSGPSALSEKQSQARGVQGSKSSKSNRTNKEQGVNAIEFDTEWSQASVTDLDLEETVVAKISTRIMTAIEACWQSGFNEKKRSDIKASPIIGATSPSSNNSVLDAHQVKLLGQVLLRHLDQEELDRIAKKKKPLRFQYEDPSQTEEEEEDGDKESSGMSNSAISNISRLARVGGIRILLQEESMHQAIPRQQLELAKSTQRTELSLEAEGEPNCDQEKRIRAIGAVPTMVISDDDAKSYFLQRLAILRQAVDLLVIPEGGNSHKENQSDSVGVSRDVSDAARFIESFFLEPLTMLANGPNETASSAITSPTIPGSVSRGASLGAKEMDGIAALKGGLGRVAKDKFIMQFGTRSCVRKGKNSNEEDNPGGRDDRDIEEIVVQSLVAPEDSPD
ncbi:AP-4 complex subunit beta-1 [Lunasporangiospora selenospora]|uniref:AP-4 complex subunit beta-1 n=1 Tax=Lunasporangiospora selenospora TaxID=979761 RepID=A0A9P6FV68_9FUNG|nr:AP-4 complex subunit beta-1 [Lunasporangiospora selenospora]